MVGVVNGCGLIVLLCLWRLCEAKQSKVYQPEHPFPHAEVIPAGGRDFLFTGKIFVYLHDLFFYFALAKILNRTKKFYYNFFFPSFILNSLLRVGGWSISLIFMVSEVILLLILGSLVMIQGTWATCTRPLAWSLRVTHHWDVAMLFILWRPGAHHLKTLSYSLVREREEEKWCIF